MELSDIYIYIYLKFKLSDPRKTSSAVSLENVSVLPWSVLRWRSSCHCWSSWHHTHERGHVPLWNSLLLYGNSHKNHVCNERKREPCNHRILNTLPYLRLATSDKLAEFSRIPKLAQTSPVFLKKLHTEQPASTRGTLQHNTYFSHIPAPKKSLSWKNPTNKISLEGKVGHKKTSCVPWYWLFNRNPHFMFYEIIPRMTG